MQSVQQRSVACRVPACPQALPRCQPFQGRPRRRMALQVFASAQGAQLLVDGKRVYESGDRLAAMKVYEKALAQPDLTADQRKSALYGMIAVHASFGDVELAQMTLRDAIAAGVDWEASQLDPSLPAIQSSPQIIIQLSRFNKQLLRQMEARADERAVAVKTAAKVQRAAPGGSTSRLPASTSDADLARMLGGSADDKTGQDTGIDASPAAIAKRVALLVLVLSGLGVALFFVGLEYMFPRY